MIRNKPILILISIFLLAAMTLADTQSLYLEKEEQIESFELEREEIKKKNGGQDFNNQLFPSLPDFLAHHMHFSKHALINFQILESSQKHIYFLALRSPLYLQYCCLKYHF